MAAAIISAVVALIGIVTTTALNVSQNRKLTGAQNEANQFTASLQEDSQLFNAQQAEINRNWQEEQYLKYNSPEAMVRQYQDAGINPALMFGGTTPAASTSSSAASSGAGSSVASSTIPVAGSIASVLQLLPEFLKTKAEIENIKADTANKQADTELKGNESEYKVSLTELNHINAEYIPVMNELRMKLDLQQYDYNENYFEQSLRRGEIDIKATAVAINKAWEEIKNLIEERKLVISKQETEDLQHILTAAQTVLYKTQSKSISLDNFQKKYENEFTEAYGTKPNQPIWNQVGGFLGNSIDNLFKKLFKRGYGKEK